MIQSNLKALMERKGVTLKQMARDTGLAEMTLIRARRGQIGACRLETLLVIAKYLDCGIEDLFTIPAGKCQAAQSGQKSAENAS